MSSEEIKRTNDTPPPDERDLIQAYLEERKSLVESQHKAAEQYDTHVLTLAAGALGISLVFLKDIAPNPKPYTLWLLCVSWVSYVVCMLSTLTSFQISLAAFMKQIEILDKWLEKRIRPDENPLRKLVMQFNWLSLGAFVLGTLMLVIFALVNVNAAGGNNEAKQTNTTTTTTTSTTTTGQSDRP